MITKKHLHGINNRNRLIAIVSALIVSAHSLWAAEIHVAKDGSDSNSGTLANPYLTINKAAAEAQPGDTVIVQEGTYREHVKPARGGTSDSNRITYRIADGAEVHIKGSEQITSWVDQGGGVWLATLPNGFFNGYNPYEEDLANGSNQDIWLRYGQDHSLGDVYLNGVTLREQIGVEANVNTMSWSSTVSASETRIWANFGGANPNTELAEINARETVFYPDVQRASYITVNGFHMSHAANHWSPPVHLKQIGIIGPKNAKSWIIENCVISNARCVGISLGKHTGGGYDFPGDINQVGDHVVRNNIVRQCGQNGINGQFYNARSLIINNIVENTNHRDEFGGWETAGIKFHGGIDTEIRGNIIRNVRGRNGAYGIWIDWANQGTRISGNVIYGTGKDCIYLEANWGPTLVDNNIFIGKPCRMIGSEGVVFAHNLFFESHINSTLFPDSRNPNKWIPHTFDRINVSETPGRDYQMAFNNIFIASVSRNNIRSSASSVGCKADSNLFLQGAIGNLNEGDQSITLSEFNAEFSSQLNLPDRVTISFTMPDAINEIDTTLISSAFIGNFPVPGQPLEDKFGNPITVDEDFSGNVRDLSNPTPGPFVGLSVGAYSFTFIPMEELGDVLVEPVTGLTAVAGDAIVLLDWDDSIDPQFDSFKVWRSLTSGTDYSLIASDLSVSNYTDNDVTNGVEYFYTVSQMDTNGTESLPSDEVSATPAVVGDTITLNPAADASVRGGGSANNNYGDDVALIVKQSTNLSYTRNLYLRFDLPNISGSIGSATLRLKVEFTENPDPDRHTAYFVSDDSWGESTITWNTKPAGSTELDWAITPAVGQWIELDVTSQVASELAGDGTFSVVIIGAANTMITYHSKEADSESDRPQLVISGNVEDTTPTTYAEAALLIDWTGVPADKRGAMDNSDGDQYNNFLTWALGGSFTEPDTDLAPFEITDLGNGQMELRISYDKAVPTLNYQLEWSTDLIDWSTIGVTIEQFQQDTGLYSQHYVAPVGTDQIFGRLEVSE